MLILRGTKKLRDRVKGPVAVDGDASTTVLGDWFGTALFWKPQAALLVNRRTLVPVLMPLAPAARLLDRAPEAIAAMMRRLGADGSLIDSEVGAMREARIAPTNDRSVVGVMNEFAFHGELRRHDGIETLEDLAVDLAGMPLGPLYNRNGSPDREFAAVVGIEPAPRTHLRLVPTGDFTPPRATAASSARVFQMKVTLKGTKPPIWRRVLVAASATLAELHEVIQAAFGWWNYHLYEFEIGGARYGIPDPDWDFGPPTGDARSARLDVVAAAGTSFDYTYDFGDDWEHKVTVEQVLDTSPVASLPACVDGRRAAPPEDCGGVWGYRELLEVLANPSHQRHAELAEWAGAYGGAELDPDAFDASEFVDNLRMLHQSTIPD